MKKGKESWKHRNGRGKEGEESVDGGKEADGAKAAKLKDLHLKIETKK